MGELLDALKAIQEPYFIHWEENLPGIDFNREIVEPGTNDSFPDGCVGIRTDGDFWCVAALPLSFQDTPLKEIVEAVWPQFAEEAEYAPDHGTTEQKIYFLKAALEGERRINKHLNKELQSAQEDIKRAQMTRPPADWHVETRRRKQAGYFIRQYERLLDATAHEHVPTEGLAGICAECGLDAGDRVHRRYYIERRRKKKALPPSLSHDDCYVNDSDQEEYAPLKHKETEDG